MTGFEADQGFVNCGDRYVMVDVDATSGLEAVLARLDNRLHEEHKGEAGTYTPNDLMRILVSRAVEKIDVLLDTEPEPAERVA